MRRLYFIQTFDTEETDEQQITADTSIPSSGAWLKA
jgi:hypothetical protein